MKLCGKVFTMCDGLSDSFHGGPTELFLIPASVPFFVLIQSFKGQLLKDFQIPTNTVNQDMGKQNVPAIACYVWYLCTSLHLSPISPRDTNDVGLRHDTNNQPRYKARLKVALNRSKVKRKPCLKSPDLSHMVKTDSC